MPTAPDRSTIRPDLAGIAAAALTPPPDHASPAHPHEPRIPAVLDPDGSCVICRWQIAASQHETVLFELRRLVDAQANVNEVLTRLVALATSLTHQVGKVGAVVEQVRDGGLRSILTGRPRP